MISPEEALDLVVRAASPLEPQSATLAEACGLVLAEEIFAERDCPPFSRSMMDGFAVRLADAGKSVPVAGEIPAGSLWPADLAAGECLEIMTGAPCPSGTEAVVPVEQVSRHDRRVVLPGTIKPGQNIVPLGSECRAGQRVLSAGQLVTPLTVGTMAMFGMASVRVIPRPTLGIITTGGELAASGQQPGPGQIRDSNGPMLAAMARQLRIPDPPQRQVEDRLDRIVQALEEMADRNIILLSGGVSLGTYDLVPQALVRYGAEIVFRGVKQKPAKPLLLARKGRQLLFGLPGNPLACHLGFHRYVAAAIGKTSGRSAPAPRFQGELLQTIEPKEGRTHFVPARGICPRIVHGLADRLAARPEFGRPVPQLRRELLRRAASQPTRRRGRRGSRLHLVCRGVLG